MREHNHQQRRHPAPEQIRRRPCELFVPRVKESRLCSVCGFTLIDHDVEPVPYHKTTGSLSYKSRNLLEKPLGLQHSRSVDGGRDFMNHSTVQKEYKLYGGLLIPTAVVQSSPRGSPFYMTRTMEGGLTPSMNSAFTKYERSPSRDSIAISDYSVSPVSFKNSPYLETPKHSRSTSITRMENLLPPPKIIKPKPLPTPRPYFRHQNSLAPTVEDEREDFIEEVENESPQMFRRIRQKRRDRSASSHGERPERRSVSPIITKFEPLSTQETVVRPPNFKEILNRFQTAASDVTPSPPAFQRHHSVRLPGTVHQNRRFTLGGEALMIDTKFINDPRGVKSGVSPVPQLQPPPVVKLRTSPMSDGHSGSLVTMTNLPSDQESDLDQENKRSNQLNIVKVALREKQPVPPKREKHFIQRRESDAYQAAVRARRTGVIGSLIEKKTELRDSDEDEPRSSPDEDAIRSKRTSVIGTPAPPIKKRQSKVMETNSNSSQGSFQATNAVAVRKPKPAHRSNSNLSAGAPRKLSSHSILSNHSNASSLRNLKEIDENSNDKHFNGSNNHQSAVGSRPATAEYISGGSDSGYPRYPNSAESSSLESPRSPSQLLRSPNPLRAKAAEDLYGQMTVQHTNTLAFIIDNYPDIGRQHGEFGDYGRDLFDEITIESLIFKSTTPLMIKEKIVLFDAAFVTPNYTEHRVTVMLTPTCQYAPLMGRLAERSGFGPSVLAEIEEPEVTLRHLLDQAGIDMPSRSSIYRIVVMPPLSVCSFHSLAAHNMHKAMNVQRYEHHVCFIMLQLLCALKVLQSDGVEHLSNNFKEFLLTYKAADLKNTLEELHHLPKLMFLREIMEEDFDDRMSVIIKNSSDSPRVGVCRYALRALCTLLNHKMHNIVPNILDRTEFSRPLRRCAELLHLDRSSSLTEAKNLLEFTFFCGRVNFDGEFEAKLWLDERRAHEVNRLVRLLADKAECLSEPRERMYIQFLLSATPRTLFNTSRQYNKL